MPHRSQSGAATVEHAGLALLLALLIIAAIAAIGAGSQDSGRELGSALARKLRCAAVGPGPCWRDPLTEAYGRPLAGAVRALAPAPVAAPGPGGALLPVDFRRCRSASCALPGPRPGLTASNRRVTAFVSVDDRRRAAGIVEITYWLYRPGLGWERVGRTATSAAGRGPGGHAAAGRRGADPGRPRDARRPQPVRVRGRRGAAVAVADRVGVS